MASVSATTSSNTLDERFAALRATGRKALVCYVTAGHPDAARSAELLGGLAEAGADVIEVGLPYSDPLMDGPVIADAVYHALRGGVRLKDVFDMVQSIAARGTAVLVMTYWNPVDRYGVRVALPE